MRKKIPITKAILQNRSRLVLHARMIHHIRLYCSCGHHGVAKLSDWAPPDRILHRTRCSVCERRATGLTSYVPGTEAPDHQAEALARVQVLPVWKV